MLYVIIFSVSTRTEEARMVPRDVDCVSVELGLEGKVVIVTGGARGIGHATVERFRAEGAIAIGWDVGETHPVDVTNRESVERALDAVMQKHGRVDVLVNNAGILRDAQLVKWKDGAVASVMDDA